MNAPSTGTSGRGRGLALGLGGAAGLAAVVLLFTDTWVMWAWRINEQQSATALAMVFVAGTLLLVGSAVVGTPGAMRLAFVVTLAFCALALWVTFAQHLVSGTSPGIPRSAAFLWEIVLLAGALGSVV
ncbi:MAG TPA: hypothetical protein VFA96_06490, partial [Nocardioides sp.]|nr:hypothetical protein [Nocardioides sp.]